MADHQERRLQLATVLFALGSAVHLLDHLRRGQTSVTEALYWTGTFALVLQVVLITLVATRHRLAPVVAVGLAGLAIVRRRGLASFARPSHVAAAS